MKYLFMLGLILISGIVLFVHSLPGPDVELKVPPVLSADKTREFNIQGKPLSLELPKEAVLEALRNQAETQRAALAVLQRTTDK